MFYKLQHFQIEETLELAYNGQIEEKKLLLKITKNACTVIQVFVNIFDFCIYLDVFKQ